MFYFGLHALTGERGVLAASDREATLASRSVELARLKAEREDLQIRAELLRDEHLSARPARGARPLPARLRRSPAIT
jgi:cell division protein FtsB